MRRLFHFSAVTFSLRGDSIPTNGSRVLITDIGGNNEEALICHPEKNVSGINGAGDWYLPPTWLSISPGARIVSPLPDRGWSRNRDVEGHRLVRLRRSSDTAEEGVLTCNYSWR